MNVAMTKEAGRHEDEIKRIRPFHPINLLFYGTFLIGCSVQTALVVRNYFRYEMVVAVRLDNGPMTALPGVTLSAEFLPFINHTKFGSLFIANRTNQLGQAHQDDEQVDEKTPELLNLHSKDSIGGVGSVKTSPVVVAPTSPTGSHHNGHSNSPNHSNHSNHADFETFEQEIAARVDMIRNASTPLSLLMDLLLDPQHLFKNCFVFDVDGNQWKRCLALTQPVVTAEQRRTDIHMHRTVYYTLFAHKLNDTVANRDDDNVKADGSTNRGRSCSNRSSTDMNLNIDLGIDRTSIYTTNSLMRLPPSNSYVAYASNRGSGRLLSIKLSLPFLDQIDRGFGFRVILHHPQLPPNSRSASKIGIVYRKHGWYALKYTHSSAKLLPAPFASNCRTYRDRRLVNKRHCIDECVKQSSVRKCNSIAFFTCLTRADLSRGPFARTMHCAGGQKCVFAARVLERCEERCVQQDCEWHVYDANIALQTSHEQPYLLIELMKPLAGLNQIYEYRAAIKPLDVFIYIGGTVGMWFGVSLLSCYQQALRLLHGRRRRLQQRRRWAHCPAAQSDRRIGPVRQSILDVPISMSLASRSLRRATLSSQPSHPSAIRPSYFAPRKRNIESIDSIVLWPSV
jgi:hypothetical protein